MWYLCIKPIATKYKLSISSDKPENGEIACSSNIEGLCLIAIGMLKFDKMFCLDKLVENIKEFQDLSIDNILVERS